jgi:putative chitinase
MTPAEFGKVMGCSDDNVAIWYGPLTNAMIEFEITTPFAQSAFLAQVGHECAGLTKFEENMNYSPQRITQVWPTRFPTLASASYYAYNPERLANQVYGNRYGNGDYTSGDGWKYRARGPIQITFADNYKACGQGLLIELLYHPERLLDPEIGARSAAWFWKSHGCNSVTTLDAVSDLINIGHRTALVGDAVGYADRLARFNTATIYA